MEKSISTQDYAVLLNDVRERIRGAQLRALRKVNRELMNLYWDVGCVIVERQEAEGWGRSVIERLAQDLQAEFPGVQGFSDRSLWYMRKLYLVYRGKEILQPLAAEISWTHNQVILDRCKDDQEREFYLRMASSKGWTRRILIQQIEGRAYENTSYQTIRELPQELRGQLPAPDQVAMLLEGLE